MPAKKTYNAFCKEAYQKFGDNIDLSEVDKDNFNYSSIKYNFICKKHNMIRNTTCKILLAKKYLCEECVKEKYRLINHKQSHRLNQKNNLITIQKIKDYFDQFKNIQVDWDNSIIDYNDKVKGGLYKTSIIKIICNIHGEQFITYNQLYKKIKGNKYPCVKCVKENANNKLVNYYNDKMNKIFFNTAKNTHGNLYDYSLVKFQGRRDKIKIICKKHGEFLQYPSIHLRGEGCPICAKQDKIYTNQYRLYNVLLYNFPNLDIIYEYHNKEIFGRQSLDMYIPSLKLGIEYQGQQHFEPSQMFIDDRHSFEKTKQLDIQKYNIAKDNNIKILYFTYYNKTKYQYFTTYYTDVNDIISIINEKINAQDEQI